MDLQIYKINFNISANALNIAPEQYVRKNKIQRNRLCFIQTVDYVT